MATMEPVAAVAHAMRNSADEAPPPTAPPPSPPPSPPAAASQGSSVPIKVLAAASLLLLAAVLYNSMGGWQSQAHTMGLKRPAAPMLQRRVRKSRYAEDADHPETVFVPRLFNRTKALEDARARMSGRQTRWSTRLAKAATIDGLAKGGGGASAKLGEAPFARGKGLGGRKASLFTMLSDGEGGIGNAFRRMRNATDAQTKKAATLAAALAGNITSPIGAQLAARRSALAAGSSPEDAAAAGRRAGKLYAESAEWKAVLAERRAAAAARAAKQLSSIMSDGDTPVDVVAKDGGEVLGQPPPPPPPPPPPGAESE